MPGIRATRDDVNDRFPIAGFSVQTGPDRYFEIMLTTDPALPRDKRSPQNFYSTRASGPLLAERGEAVFLAPAEVLQAFRSTGADKIYFGLATFPDATRSRVDFLRAPGQQSPYVNLRGYTGRGMKRMQLGGTNRAIQKNGSGNYSIPQQQLTWAGDQAQPGTEKVSPAPTPKVASTPDKGVHGNGTPATAKSAALDYDDGFGAMPAPFEETAQDEPGIEGPIPDAPVNVAGLGYSRAQTTSPEYPQASRFAPANSGNFRATSGRTINRVVIHITDGGANINGPISWFQNPSARVSAHYIVGQDGEVVQMVLHKDVAWHASSANGDSIGIEHVANTRGLNPTDAEYCASAALVSWLCDQFGIPKDRDHILGHSEADPRTTHSGCPNSVWDWDYFMSMVTTDSCMPRAQAARAQAVPKRTPQEQRARPQSARSLSDECFDVNWNDVQLVPQPNNMSCWAASAAMIVGWRDRVCVNPQDIASLVGRSDEFTQGLNPNNRDELAAEWGLSVEPPQCYSVEGFRRLLENYGPLWVGVAVPSGHAVVATGLAGDGTPEGTIVRYHDPWPPGQGAAFAQKSFRQFMTEYENRMTVDDAGNVNVQILRAADTGGRLIGSGVAQGLAANGHSNGKPANGKYGIAARKFATAASAVGARRAGTFEADEIPLDPGAGGMSIDTSALAIGDIIVSTTGAFISGAIRWATGSPVSHAMLYIGDGLVVDSIGSGVDVRTIEQAMSDATLAVAFRVPNLDQQQALIAKDYVGQQLRHGYDHIGILEQALFQLSGRRARVNLGSGSNDRFFCSELIFAAFQEAGCPLATNQPSWGSPEDLAQLRLNHVLEYVGHLKAPPLLGAQGLGFRSAPSKKPRAVRTLNADQDELAAGMRTQGLSEEEIAQFLADWGLGGSTQTAAASGLSAFALDEGTQIRVQRPAVQTLSPARTTAMRIGWSVASRIATAPLLMFPGLGTSAAPFLTMLADTLPLAARQFGVTIGIGPNVGAFAVAGGSIGAGVVFGPDGRIGVYGSIELGAGWAASVSAVAQITIVRGGIEEFAGDSVAIVISGGEEIVGGVAVLLDNNQNFQGVSFQMGIGAGITPIDIYMSAQSSRAITMGLAARQRTAKATSLASAKAPPQRRIIRPQARGLNDPGEITPDYSQIHSTGAAISTFVDWLQRQVTFRTGVQDTSFFPHSVIAKLRLIDGSGNLLGEGSGFYVGRNKIVTAGHCLVNDDGSRVQGVEVVPGMCGTNEPFGGASVALSGLIPHPRYNPLAYDPSFDIGVIIGAPDAPLGSYFEMEELTFSPNTGIITCGYAAVGVDPTIQHMDVDTIRELHNGTFTYAAQVRQGSSGGPVFYAQPGSIRAVGLNVTTYDDHQNRGLRLTDALISWINSL